MINKCLLVDLIRLFVFILQTYRFSESEVTPAANYSTHPSEVPWNHSNQLVNQLFLKHLWTTLTASAIVQGSILMNSSFPHPQKSLHPSLVFFGLHVSSTWNNPRMIICPHSLECVLVMFSTQDKDPNFVCVLTRFIRL